MVGFDLLRQLPDIAASDAELIVAGTVLGVLRTHLLVAERFELRESFFERHGRDCSVGRPRLGVRDLATGPAMIPTGNVIIGATVLLIWAAWREVMNGEPGG